MTDEDIAKLAEKSVSRQNFSQFQNEEIANLIRTLMIKVYIVGFKDGQRDEALTRILKEINGTTSRQ